MNPSPKKIPPVFPATRRSGAIPASFFLLALVSLLVLTGAGNLPVQNFQPVGPMQSDLNAGVHNLTNAATISATNYLLGGHQPNTASGLVALDTNGLIPLDPRTANLNNQCFVFYGDSITSGGALPSPSTQVFGYLFSQMPFAKNHGTYINAGIGGAAIMAGLGSSSLIDSYATAVHPYRPVANGGSTPGVAWLFLMAGINDIANESRTSAQVITDLTTLVSTAKADGFKVVVFTILPRNGNFSTWNSTFEGYRLAVNQAIRSNQLGATRVADFETVVQNPSDTNYYIDGLHPSVGGNVAMANYLESGMVQGVFPTGQNSPNTDSVSHNFSQNQTIAVAGSSQQLTLSNTTTNFYGAGGGNGPGLVFVGPVQAPGYGVGNHVFFNYGTPGANTNFFSVDAAYGTSTNFDLEINDNVNYQNDLKIDQTGLVTLNKLSTSSASITAANAFLNLNHTSGNGAGLNANNTTYGTESTLRWDFSSAVNFIVSIKDTGYNTKHSFDQSGNYIASGTVTAANVIDNGVTASTLAKFNGSKQLVSATAGTDYLAPPTPQRFSPTTGSTVTISSSSTANLVAFITPAGTLATLTISMPTGGFDGQVLRLATSQILTAITFSGATTSAAATGMSTAKTGLNFVWDATATTWRQD